MNYFEDISLVKIPENDFEAVHRELESMRNRKMHLLSHMGTGSMNCAIQIAVPPKGHLDNLAAI